LCLEYNKASEEDMLQWIENVNDVAISKGINFLKIAVFARYNELKSYEVARLKRQFTRAGAFLTDFSKTGETLLSAVKNYNRRMSLINSRVNNEDVSFQTRPESFDHKISAGV
jgi:hypothetical protein